MTCKMHLAFICLERVYFYVFIFFLKSYHQHPLVLLTKIEKKLKVHALARIIVLFHNNSNALIFLHVHFKMQHKHESHQYFYINPKF